LPLPSRGNALEWSSFRPDGHKLLITLKGPPFREVSVDSMLARLFQHLEWADRGLLASFEQAGDPPPEALKLLAHLLAAEHIWLARIQAEGPPAHPVWPALAFPECRALADRNRQGYRALLDSLTASQLDAPVAYRDSRGNPFSTGLGDILLHVALHGAHHRGQIAALLRAAGRTPASTDYILFARSRQA